MDWELYFLVALAFSQASVVNKRSVSTVSRARAQRHTVWFQTLRRRMASLRCVISSFARTVRVAASLVSGGVGGCGCRGRS